MGKIAKAFITKKDILSIAASSCILTVLAFLLFRKENGYFLFLPLITTLWSSRGLSEKGKASYYETLPLGNRVMFKESMLKALIYYVLTALPTFILSFWVININIAFYYIALYASLIVVMSTLEGIRMDAMYIAIILIELCLLILLGVSNAPPQGNRLEVVCDEVTINDVTYGSNCTNVIVDTEVKPVNLENIYAIVSIGAVTGLFVLGNLRMMKYEDLI